MMSLGTGIVVSGFAYGCACHLGNNVSHLGIIRGRRMALFCLALGITVDLFFSA